MICRCVSISGVTVVVACNRAGRSTATHQPAVFIQARVSVVRIVVVILKVMCFDNGLITMDKIISLIPDLTLVKAEELPAPTESITPVDDIL